MSAFKPGDRALVVGYPDHAFVRINGRVVGIESAPFHPNPADCNRPPRGLSCRVSGIEPWDTLETVYLIRLPPDDEAKQLFRETEKPREVCHG